MIDFTRAFDTAWERTIIILFRPFDPMKWFAIGFSAFLAGLLSGGNGVNGSSFQNNGKLNNFSFNSQTQTSDLGLKLHQFHASFANAIAGLQFGLVVVLIVAIVFFVLVLILLMYWLGTRGQFLFLDNLVRNRGAIAWPWSHYARQGNALFGFYLLLVLLTLVVLVPFVIVGVVMGLPLYRQHRWPEGWEIGSFALLGVAYLAVASVIGFIIFIFKEFGVPLMFRNGLSPTRALVESLGLIQHHFLSVFVFVLLRFALFIGLVIISVLTCCLTCCIATIPYVGTVLLLPALVFVRCFSLECLAQFGPEYDVWTVDVPPPGSASSPQPPRG